MNTLITIVPIFAVIFIGWVLRVRGIVADSFFAPANRLVYYLAIPAMVFRSISNASLESQFSPLVLGISLFSATVVFGASWVVARPIGISPGRRGTFIQNSFHGNLGYIGLAVAFYYLGEEGLTRASLIAGFLMILQNFLAVIALQFHRVGRHDDRYIRRVLLKIAGNPIVLSALAGIAWSLLEIPVPLVLERCLSIISGLALPLALLIIGGSLTFDLLRIRLATVAFSTGFKLLLTPAIGFALCSFFKAEPSDALPAVILLASPTATVSYVMAREMEGDADSAVVAISFSTLLSALTFIFWLTVAG
jgi:predicted permease